MRKNQRSQLLSICTIALMALIVMPQAAFPVHATLSGRSSATATNPIGFDGLNMTVSGGNFPPDVQAAAGPNQIIQIVNREVALYNKQGVQSSSVTLTAFFNTGSDWTFDPRVIYDSLSGRWLALVDDNTPGLVKIAVSTTSNPTLDPTNWKLYRFGTPAAFCPDQPRIGVSSDKVIITADQFAYNQPPPGNFACFGAQFYGPQYWVLSKTDLINGASMIHNVTIGPTLNIPGSLQPVQSLSPSTTLYMVTTGQSANNVNSVRVISVSGVPPATVSNSSTTLQFPTSVTAPPQLGAPQPLLNGQTFYLDTFSEGVRIQGSSWYQGKLWLAFNSGCTPAGDNRTRDCVHLTEISTSSLTISQDFDYGAKGQYYFYPAVSIDVNGNLDFVYGFSNSTTYPSLATSGQAFNDPANALARGLTIKAGTATWSDSRWGDYFAASVDPSDPTLVWVAGEYEKPFTFGGWPSFIASMRLLVPDFTISSSPQCFNLNSGQQTTVTVTLTSINNFAATVALSSSISPSGRNSPTITISPNSITLTSGASLNSTATVTTTSRTPTGLYIATVTGTSGSLSHASQILVYVNTPPTAC